MLTTDDKMVNIEEILENSETVVAREDAEPTWREVEFTTENSFADLVAFLNAANERICDLEDKIAELEKKQNSNSGFFRTVTNDDMVTNGFAIQGTQDWRKDKE